MKTFEVKESQELFDFLQTALSGWSKKTVKQHLKFGSILVNDQIRTRFDLLLNPGDKVSISPEKRPLFQKVLRRAAIQPVYEDQDIIVVDKPPGLLTIANIRTKTETLYYKVTDYVRSGSPTKEARIFVVHRLDQDVSGLIVFAKNEESKHGLQDNWEEVEKKYFAVTEGTPPEQSGEIRSYLIEDAAHRMRSVKKGGEARLAITRYKVLKENPRFSLLEITLVTGRKNQIRVHLSEMGNPIVGDEKYGATTKLRGRIALHSYWLEFPHPRSGKKMLFQLELPSGLRKLVRPEPA